MNIFINIVSFMFMCIRLLYGFNLDLEDRVVLSGPANSYFGYSVAIVGNKWILVGSPRANDSNMPNVTEPGGVHKCEVTKTTPSSCQQLNIETTGTVSLEKLIPFNGNTEYVSHGRRGQWLGGSMAVPTAGSGKGIIIRVCAPRWFNRYDYDCAMNGLCYELPLSLNTDNPRMLAPFAGSAKYIISTNWGTTEFNFGMAGMGIDAHYTQRDSHLLLGAPGVKYWTGGFIDVTGTTGKFMESEINNVNNTRSELVGYSVTSGSYFGDGVTYFVLGVPRANLTGKVILFDSRATEYRLENIFTELYGLEKSKESIPMNAYFGGTLCTIDVNHDGVDDLLVGAPMYSDITNVIVDDFTDMGSVFLYKGSREKPLGFKTPAKIFSGSRSPYARFGTAIGNLGDVNKDDYNDVAIGAPYEDDLSGCVYVYNGYKNGLWPKYSQRISAKQFIPIPKGFGIAISPAADINNDNINDVAIGAYMSDHVFVLHGQPVINIQAEMKVQNNSSQDVMLIHVNRLQNTSVRMCLKYTDIDSLCEFVVLNTSISLDTQKGKLGRLVFKDKDSPILHSQVKMFRGATSCTKDGLLEVKNAHDLISGIVVIAEYEVADTSCAGADISPTLNKFDGNIPGDPVLYVQKILYFKTECPENNCHTDLHVAARTEFAGVDGYFVIGKSDLIIHVNITKDGHSSYGSAFVMFFPNYLRYRKIKQLAGGTEVSCPIESTNEQFKETDNTKPDSLVKEAGESMLSCSFGNPLVNNSGVEFSLYMEVPDEVTVPSFELNINATSKSNETSVGDNEKTLAVNLRYHVQTSVTGISKPLAMFIRDTTPDSTVTHVYELTNNGPSILPSAVLGFHYPQKQQGTTADLYLNATKIRCVYPCMMNCTFRDHVKAPQVHRYLNSKLMTENKSMKQEYTTKNNLDCSNGSCSVYECRLNNLLTRRSAVVELEFVISKGIQGELQSSRSTDIVSVASIQLEKERVIADKTLFDIKLTTRLLISTHPAAELRSIWWVIVVSAVSGFLLVWIIVIIMFKRGFFERKKRDELVKLKRQIAMMKHQSTINTPNVTKSSQGAIIDKEPLPAINTSNVTKSSQGANIDKEPLPGINTPNVTMSSQGAIIDKEPLPAINTHNVTPNNFWKGSDNVL